MEISTIGLDLAKSIFQVHAVGEDGKAVEEEPAPFAGFAVLQEAAALPDRHRGVRHLASLGEGTGGTWARGEADAASLREALREARQDRRQ